MYVASVPYFFIWKFSMNEIIKVHNAEEYILQIFKNHNIIGLGEGEHNLVDSHQFFQKLLSNKKIQETVNIIIVEFANAAYQDILDKYIFGEEVSVDELRKIWRESTQCINLFGEATVYFELLKKIRNINFTLTSNKKIRVLGGDPSIDWTSIRSLEDYLKINKTRDSFAADLAIEYGIKRSMKVLMIYAEYHLTKISDKADNNRIGLPSITSNVNTKYPDSMQVIAVFNSKEFQLPEETKNWPLYCIVNLDKEEIGNLPAENYFTQIFNKDGRVILFEYYKIKELFNSFLYIGQSENWQRVNFSKPGFSDEEWNELNRRRQIFGDKPLNKKLN